MNQLSTSIYEAGVNGTVYFRVDTYRNSGDQLTSDLIPIYIDNSGVVKDLHDIYFTTSVSDDCVLFALTDAEINQPLPLRVIFKANDLNGFLQSYGISMGKGKYNTAFATVDDISSAPILIRVNSSGQYNSITCANYYGTADGASGYTGLV